MGREILDCQCRVDAIEREARSIDVPLVVVAHSGGVITVAHWAHQTNRQVVGALLATPADLETPLPPGYPVLDQFRAGGWLPIPRKRLPFPAIVAASDNDPLASLERVTQMSSDWGAKLERLGRVGHLNPASGYGEWPQALNYVHSLAGIQGLQIGAQAGKSL
jgi:predicted alpha/beta hydrolase family esterase